MLLIGTVLDTLLPPPGCKHREVKLIHFVVLDYNNQIIIIIKFKDQIVDSESSRHLSVKVSVKI